MKNMIYDCFIFNNELDLLKIRCEELKELQVTHILIESCQTFTGNIKKNVFKENEKLFKEYNIIPYSVSSSNANPWDNEKFQRNYILSALKELHLNDEDTIIISDVDEVPRTNAIKKYNSNMGITALIMDKFGYYLNCLEGAQSWKSARIMPFSYLKDKTPDEVRNSGYQNELKDAGWHWSWLGGIDKVIEKFNSFSHQELNNEKFANPEKLAYKISTGQSLWGEDFWKFTDIDKTFPLYLQENLNQFSKFIMNKK